MNRRAFLLGSAAAIGAGAVAPIRIFPNEVTITPPWGVGQEFYLQNDLDTVMRLISESYGLPARMLFGINPDHHSRLDMQRYYDQIGQAQQEWFYRSIPRDWDWARIS